MKTIDQASIEDSANIAVDLIIIGAGPVGLFGAYYAGCRGLSIAVIDALDELGGQVNAMYPEKEIFDIAGFPAIRGRELISSLIQQANQFQPTYLCGERAEKLDVDSCPPGAAPFRIYCESGRQVTGRAVIITGGIGAFTPRQLGVGEEFHGRGLAYFVQDPGTCAGQDVVIVGGGDSALDWALTLEPIARSVTLVHRRDRFRAHESTVAAVRASSVRVVTGAEIVEVVGDEKVTGVRISRPDSDEHLACDRLVAALGFVANLGPIRDWGIELAGRRHIIVDSAMRTSVPGIFSAGDITEYDGKVRLIAVGFGEVATAVNNAAVFINPEAGLFPGHSTDTPPR
ncbi:NAD(P)/FAD-dependent oxidoreductase [Nocardioides daejeonensis]|uniref:NAD(P)/FAD-dependent oxidoreductase n=1 Tax=Nocardioides daejeonensis TaxID=1046556 RepID=UPI001EF493BF|nr:NAD(P)/FAD-dependent oxidoreductase [Nocardioides daejeonensis]